MLAGMTEKPGIAIVGAGNLAQALAPALRRAGYQIDEVITRSRGRSLTRTLKSARELARQTGARAVEISGAILNAEVVWFCVPDGEIAGAAQALASKTDWRNKIAFHSSGALTGDELESLRRRGAAVASVHPLMTFVRGARSGDSKRGNSKSVKSDTTGRDSKAVLTGVPFAIEGDDVAVRSARRIVKALGGTAHSIRKQDKAAYHAWGTFASPLLTALLVTTEHVAGIAGITRKAARQRMLPILQQTLANYAAFDAAEAFSGPIIRGDVATVKRHLQVLRREPVAREVYVALARAALAYLPAKNKSELKNLLQSAGK
jgi:predicted short-subunit dehydrogenase-like oxidoreductase (DUF2520 family)